MFVNSTGWQLPCVRLIQICDWSEKESNFVQQQTQTQRKMSKKTKTSPSENGFAKEGATTEKEEKSLLERGTGKDEEQVKFCIVLITSAFDVTLPVQDACTAVYAAAWS